MIFSSNLTRGSQFSSVNMLICDHMSLWIVFDWFYRMYVISCHSAKYSIDSVSDVCSRYRFSHVSFFSLKSLRIRSITNRKHAYSDFMSYYIVHDWFCRLYVISCHSAKYSIDSVSDVCSRYRFSHVSFFSLKSLRIRAKLYRKHAYSDCRTRVPMFFHAE